MGGVLEEEQNVGIIGGVGVIVQVDESKFLEISSMEESVRASDPRNDCRR